MIKKDLDEIILGQKRMGPIFFFYQHFLQQKLFVKKKVYNQHFFWIKNLFWNIDFSDYHFVWTTYLRGGVTKKTQKFGTMFQFKFGNF